MLGLGGFERTQRYDVIRRKSAPIPRYDEPPVCLTVKGFLESFPPNETFPSTTDR
jgi:hypothetical protein